LRPHILANFKHLSSVTRLSGSDLTRGFASQSRDWFAVFGEGPPFLILQNPTQSMGQDTCGNIPIANCQDLQRKQDFRWLRCTNDPSKGQLWKLVCLQIETSGESSSRISPTEELLISREPEYGDNGLCYNSIATGIS
jgi:hypothetical protein